MYERTDFVIRQLQRLKKALEEPSLAGFKPDGRNPAHVSWLLTTLDSAKTDALRAGTLLNGARGTADSAWDTLHQHCVSVSAAMRSLYRLNAPALRTIQRIPSKDETPRSTLARAAVTVSTWAKLPPIPNTNPPEPFKVGALTLAAFKSAIADLQLRLETLETCTTDSDFNRETLTQCTRDSGEFVSAAVAQGRAQFMEGTVARKWIETIPLELGTQPPLQAEITDAESLMAGAVHLEFEASYATSFTIQHRLESDVEFVTVAEGVTDEFWDTTNLPPGNHQYIVLGVNSRGPGPASDIATVPVAADSLAAA